MTPNILLALAAVVALGVIVLGLRRVGRMSGRRTWDAGVVSTRWLAELTAIAKESAVNYESGAKSTDKDIKKYAESGIALAKEKVAVLEKMGR